MNHRENISQLAGTLALPAITSDTWACPAWHPSLASRYRLTSWMVAPKPEPDIRKTRVFGHAPGRNSAANHLKKLVFLRLV